MPGLPLRASVAPTLADRSPAMELTLSHATGPTEPPLRDITLGQLLAWAAETTPDRVALIAGVPDPAARRQWTYAELLPQALRTAQGAARALRARRARRGVGAEPARVGDAGVRLRAGRRGAGDGEPGLPRAGAGVRAEAVALGRHVRRRGLPRQPDARHGAAGGAELPRAARGDPLRRSGTPSWPQATRRASRCPTCSPPTR